MLTDRKKLFTFVLVCLGVLVLTTYAHASTFTIGGTISGLTTGSSVTLLDNGGDSLKVSANGKFTFKTALATGATYAVTVGTQPTGETCTVTAGTGTVGTTNVTTVKVTCKVPTFTIGGTLSSLVTGQSITLLDNGASALKLTKNGTFSFATQLKSGATYNVTINVQPVGETCTVTGGSGTVGTSNVTSVKVACTPKDFTIGGTVSGLTTGKSVTLLDNGSDSLTVTANGAFTFATSVASGSAYKVTVKTQPTGETCTVTGGSGKVVSSNVTTVKVACTPKTFTIGGTVSGLSTGASVTLLDNGADSLTVTANGKFTFTTKVASGSTYAVTVGTQPTGETCPVTSGSGTVGAANVTTVKVACASSSTFSIGGTVSGLNTSASVTLLDNGSDSLTVTANGAFTFKTKLASGAKYAVTVGTQPTGETCTVTGGTGTVGTANVTTVKVVCGSSSSTFSIGGTVSGLSTSASVTLLDNGTDSLTVTANGAFNFKTKLASGAKYAVTVGTQPTGETCTVSNGSGTVGSSNVTNVGVSCSTSTGGGGAFWIPYSASPIPGQTPAGKNGLFLIPSDKLSSAPTPTFVTTDNTKLLGIGTKISESGGVLTYSPQVMMYADTNSSGVTNVFGLTLAGTSTVPTPTQISNLALPSGQQVCNVNTALTDVTTPTSLFAVIEVGTSTQCAAATGTFEVIHYTDSATTAPVVVSINNTEMNAIYQSGKLTGLLLYESTTNSFNLYADDTFKSPTELITSVQNVTYVAGVLDAATLSTTGYFYSVTSTASVNTLYRVDGSTLTASQIQSLKSGTVTNAAQDDSNLYYVVLNGSGTTFTATFEQVALTGGTPTTLYTSPSFTSGAGTVLAAYQLIGSNDSVVAFEFYSDPYTNGLQDPTKATATLYSVPVGKTTTTPTTLANYTAGNELPLVFLASPSGAGYPGNVLFATVMNSTGTPPLVTVAYSAVSIPLNGGTPPAPIKNSVYAPLAVISSGLTDDVWQVTGITDTNGGYGGGTANQVNVGTLADTPFTTTGGKDYVVPAGFEASLFAISSNNIALGFLENAPAVIYNGATLQENGVAADLSSGFLLPISLTNTAIVPY